MADIILNDPEHLLGGGIELVDGENVWDLTIHDRSSLSTQMVYCYITLCVADIANQTLKYTTIQLGKESRELHYKVYVTPFNRRTCAPFTFHTMGDFWTITGSGFEYYTTSASYILTQNNATISVNEK